MTLPTSFTPADLDPSIVVAKNILIQSIEDGIGIDEKIIDHAAEAVHVAWVERHPHGVDGAARPYSDLPENEKDAYRDLARQARGQVDATSV